MVKIKQHLILGLISLILFSCTLKEDIQRDVVIETDSIGFTIPILTNLENTVIIAELKNSIDLSQNVTESTDQFTIADLRSAQITKFVIKLDNPDTNGNGISAFSYLSVQLQASGKPSIQLGANTNIPTSYATTINITVTATTQQLQDYLNAPDLTYVISGQLRDATTKALQAKAVAGYKLTLGM
ncbi:hypothetical protein [Pedobacter sp.]|uniref:hypothetical protein n=1 Tax=Pedobacter sp. TaxID=1411316 RepID=UPI003D7FAB83